MTACNPSKLVPTLRWRPLLYRTILRASRRHGLFTIARYHVNRFPTGQIVYLPGGGKMFIPPNPHFVGYLTRLHEEHITKLLQEVVKPGSLCVDVGANIGYFSIIMSALAGPSGSVYSYEPVRDNFDVLCQNASSVPSSAAPVFPRMAAVSDTCGFVTIVDGGESTLHQVKKSFGFRTSNAQIPSISLDSVIGEVPEQKITVLKIDVEGHELPVIEGSQKMLECGLVENLVIEVTPGEDVGRLEALIAPKSRSIRCWINRNWVNAPISGIKNRTDVWVKF